MALKKSIKAPSGAVATYWRIAGIMLHEWERTLEVYLAGFLDEATRREVKEDGAPAFTPLSAVNVRLTTDQWLELFGAGEIDYPPKATLYEFLKTLPEWQGAKDA